MAYQNGRGNNRGYNNKQKNVNVNINKNVGPRKRGNVINAINYAYKTIDYMDSEEAKEMINYVISHNKTSRYDIEQTIYQIIKSYRVIDYMDSEEAKEMVWKALKK